jgi:microcystin-dependent protein
MGVVNTTYTFTSTDTITSAKMNNIIDDTTFTSDAIQGTTLQVVSPGKLAVSAGGITSNELASNSVVTAKIADSNVTTAKIADASVTLAKLAPESLFPSGAVMAFAMATAPVGWLQANGDTIPNGNGTVQGKTADFSALYALIGTTYGTAGTLPDLRGYFVRGSGTNGDTTESGAFGEKQADTFKSHNHPIITVGPPGSGGATGLAATGTGSPVGTVTTYIIATGGDETRPKNIAMLYCIKI